MEVLTLPSVFQCSLAPYTEVITTNDRANQIGIREEKTLSFASFIGLEMHKTTVPLAAVDARGKVIAKLTTVTKCMDKIQPWL